MADAARARSDYAQRLAAASVVCSLQVMLRP
jgi:hypothetical protein